MPTPLAFTTTLQLASQTILLGEPGATRTPAGILELTHIPVPGGARLQLTFTPNGPQTIQACWLEQPVLLAATDRILCNGFQSWTDSPLLSPAAGIPQLRRLARPFMGYSGDYHIPWIPRHRGYLHSWSWTELRRVGQPLLFLGSLNENQAYTCFQWQQATGRLRIQSDCGGLTVHQPMVLLDFLILSGTTTEVYDRWQSMLGLPPLRAQPARGWTSWYQHYTHISADIITDNLQAYQSRGSTLDFFQIDDGFQTAVGDWLSVRPNFPDGMKAVADEIKIASYTPGLWLAPCVADKRSQLFAQHPEWLQKNSHGKPLKVGFNPLWGGWFYALDTQHPGWQDYMREVFTTVVQQWGFGLLKLDFLYAAAIFPTATQTRAQIMRKTLEFIKEISGDAYLLGCGTPLAPGFGIFDYCRIGADIHLQWEHKFLHWLRHRERVSTHVALRTTIGRWPLAGRVWRNDPDVYLLRDENIQLTHSERSLVHRLNTLLGEVLFTSDNVSTYGSWQEQEEAWQREWLGTQVLAVAQIEDDIFMITTARGDFQVTLESDHVLVFLGS
jgi:alpha-galactosidase